MRAEFSSATAVANRDALRELRNNPPQDDGQQVEDPGEEEESGGEEDDSGDQDWSGRP